jgi:hypothetical protein
MFTLLNDQMSGLYLKKQDATYYLAIVQESMQIYLFDGCFKGRQAMYTVPYPSDITPPKL